MSEDKSSGGAPDVTSGDANADKHVDAGSADKVSYDTYKKTLNEVKKFKEQAKEAQTLKDKLAEYEQNEQMRMGKHEETIATLRKQLDETKKSEKSVYQKFAFKSLGEQVSVEALKHGCVDTSALMKLVDLSEVEMDSETFEADKDRLVQIVSEAKTSRPYLFNKAAPGVNGKAPNGGNPPDKKIDFNKMSGPEIQDWLNKNR